MAHSNRGHGQLPSSSRLTGRKQSGAAHDKVYHTVTACRKTRCDPGLPRCDGCERNNTRCEWFDTTKNRTVPRDYITSLQASLSRVQEELAALEKEEKHVPDAETMIRGAGMIRFNDKDEHRFLGPSSGIAITRLVMELAKQNTVNKSIREIVTDVTAREIKEKFDEESSKPTSKIYPLISSVAAPHLPTQELMDKLVEIYMAKAQYMLPLLHEPSFRHDIQAVYHGSNDATLNFQFRLVIAISMQKLDTQYAGLADSYYLAALPYLEAAVRKRDISTLQCLALIAQYSTLTPTRTASYWVVGLAARLCQELGLCEEHSVKEWPAGTRLNTLVVDMRRRLFWIITSMEYGLAHSLGRPSSFGVAVNHINVAFFQLCDDRFITPAGLLPGHQPIMKKCIAIHFFRMRLLQAEIRRTLYLKKRDSPLDDRDPWFSGMQHKIDEWVETCPKNDEGSGLSEAWFHARRNTMIVFLYRPSPQIPEPSEQAAESCFNASVTNVNMQSKQIATKSVDLTWIFTQSLFMALNTILWSLSYAEIRQMHPLDEVKIHLDTALKAINHTSERWPGVNSALQLYENLIQGCLKAYSSNASFIVRTPKTVEEEAGLSPAPVSLRSSSPAARAPTTHQSPQSQHTSPGGSEYQYQAPTPLSQIDSFAQVEGGAALPNLFAFPQDQQQQSLHPQASFQPTFRDFSRTPTQPALLPDLGSRGLPSFDPNSVHNEFPSTIPGLPQWNPATSLESSQQTFPGYVDVAMDARPWLGSFGEEYSRYTQQAYYPPEQQMQSLTEQQQLELMAALEQDQLPDVSNLVNDAAASYMGNVL